MPEAIEVVFKRRRLDYFMNPERVPITSGDYVVVEADRGLDLGQVRHLAVPVKAREKQGRFRTIVRRAQERDLERADRLRHEEEDATRLCKDRIRRLGLEMKLVDVESQLDGNLLTFYFTAESRVDFRELVKELASTFRTRIELRQIGARDAAKRIGGIGPCGREYCCSTWLKEFQPVTLKMAKNQGLALAPSKISGGCGRLMCCLMYEDPTYRELAKLFPKQGTRVDIQGRELTVVANDYFREVVRMRDEEGNATEWPIDGFPVPREQWKGALRARGAPGRGGADSGCGKHDPKPTGMLHARGAGASGDDPRKKRIPIDRAEFGGAPLLKGGRGRRPMPARPGEECPPPADLLRFRARERRTADGLEIGGGVGETPEENLFERDDAELVGWFDPDTQKPAGEPPRTDEKPPERDPRFRKRRRRGRRSGGSARAQEPGGQGGRRPDESPRPQGDPGRPSPDSSGRGPHGGSRPRRGPGWTPRGPRGNRPEPPR